MTTGPRRRPSYLTDLEGRTSKNLLQIDSETIIQADEKMRLLDNRLRNILSSRWAFLDTDL